MLTEWMDGWKKLAEQQQAMLADQAATTKAAMQQWINAVPGQDAAKPMPWTVMDWTKSQWQLPAWQTPLWTVSDWPNFKPWLPADWSFPDWTKSAWPLQQWATLDWHKVGLDSLQAYPLAQLFDPAHVDGREEADWNRAAQAFLAMIFWPMWAFTSMVPGATAATPEAGPAPKRTASKPAAPRKRAAAEPANAPAVVESTVPEQPFVSTGPEPVLLDGPKGKADDLLVIKGVGPKINGILNSLGVYHYAQIAAWTPAQVEWVEEKLDFKGRIGREDWIAQAKKLMTH